jgi:hypothetical protein
MLGAGRIGEARLTPPLTMVRFDGDVITSDEERRYSNNVSLISTII